MHPSQTLGSWLSSMLLHRRNHIFRSMVVNERRERQCHNEFRVELETTFHLVAGYIRF